MAKALGYRVYKPMLHGKVLFFYIKENLPRKTRTDRMSPQTNELDLLRKATPGFSYVLTPEEERFLKHLKEIEFLKKLGHKVDFTRGEYMRRMGLREYTFNQCGKSLCRLGLVVKTSNSSRNRVHYRINEPVYEKLIRIVSTTRNIDRLIEFFSFHVFKLGKSIDELTDEEIARLVL